MPSLTIRNILEDDLRWLRGRAAARGRSLNAELLDLIAVARADEQAASHTDNPFAPSMLLARSLGVRTPRSAGTVLSRDRRRDAGP